MARRRSRRLQPRDGELNQLPVLATGRIDPIPSGIRSRRCDLRRSPCPQDRRGMQQRETPTLLAKHRSEEHTSELQSRQYLVCRLLLEKKKKKQLHNEKKHLPKQHTLVITIQHSLESC